MLLRPGSQEGPSTEEQSCRRPPGGSSKENGGKTVVPPSTEKVFLVFYLNILALNHPGQIGGNVNFSLSLEQLKDPPHPNDKRNNQQVTLQCPKNFYRHHFHQGLIRTIDGKSYLT